MKLPLEESEHAALRDELARWDGVVSSVLLRVEALRACSRYGADEVARARAGLDGVALVPVDDGVVEAAAALRPPELRALDALHVATALTLEKDVGVVIAYDERLAAAADAAGLPVAAPS